MPFVLKDCIKASSKPICRTSYSGFKQLVIYEPVRNLPKDARSAMHGSFTDFIIDKSVWYMDQVSAFFFAGKQTEIMIEKPLRREFRF